MASIKDEKLKRRGHWQKARVIEVVLGKDGVVKTMRVKATDGSHFVTLQNYTWCKRMTVWKIEELLHSLFL